MGDRLKGKVAIIGGGTSGMGTAMVELFAAEGAKVVFSGRRADRGEALAEKVCAQGYDVCYVQGDFTKLADMEHVVAVTVEKYGTVDVLVNNAAYSVPSPMLDMDVDKQFYPTMELNVRSYFAMSKLVLPYMIEKGNGSIINISSASGTDGSPRFSMYAASKGAVNLLTKSCAMEYAKYGVRCNAVAPGMTYTEKMIKGSPHAQASLAVVPMQRGGEAMEQAYAALFFATDECRYCTGAILPVDGGQTCGPMRPEE